MKFNVLLIAANVRKGGAHRINNSQDVIRVTNATTTTGYIVRRGYYRKIIKNFRQGLRKLVKNIQKPRRRHFVIDRYWIRLQRVNRWFCLAYQKESYSDIQRCNVKYRMK